MLKKNNRYPFYLLIVFLLPIFFLNFPYTNATAADQGPSIVTILLCPLGCGPTEGDTILGSLIARKDPNLILRAQETPGYVYNLREMGMNKARWSSTVFATEDDMLNYAPLGGKAPFTEFFPQPIKEKFKLLYGEAWWTQGHWWVTLDPNLKKISDLKGKKLGIGLRTQSDWGMNAIMDLEFGYGITPKNTKIFYLGPAKEVEELLNGKVDAIVMGMGAEPQLKEWLIAGPMRTLEASGRNLYYIGMEKEVINKLNKKFGTSYMALTVPPKTLKDQDKPLIVGADRGYKAAHPTFPDELAYKLVKAVAEYGPQMAKLHGLWKIWSPELMVGGLTEQNTHPGAIKAFKELGYWDKRTSSPPVKLWWEK
jgi:TRAP transporter TAXI family solute receptor